MAPRATSADADRVEEWRTLLDRHARIGCALESSLQSEHGIGLSEFEILDRLVEREASCSNGPDKCRLTDLSEDIYLSQSALSRAVARLEKDGLVERQLCTEDRRAIFVALTQQGRELHAAARPTHRDVLAHQWS